MSLARLGSSVLGMVETPIAMEPPSRAFPFRSPPAAQPASATTTKSVSAATHAACGGRTPGTLTSGLPLAPLGRRIVRGRVMFSGRDGGVGDAGVECLFELPPGAAECGALGDVAG